MDPTTQVQFLAGVGPVRARRLAKLAIETIEDLLWHVPRTHMDRSNLAPVSKLRPGVVETTIAVIGTTRSRRTSRGMTLFEAEILGEEGGRAAAVWFNQGYLAKTLVKGTRVLLHGKVVRQAARGVQMQSPEYEVLGSASMLDVPAPGARGSEARHSPARAPETRQSTIRAPETRHTAGGGPGARGAAPGKLDAGRPQPLHGGRVVPLYPLTAGITQKQMRTWVQNALVQIGSQLIDPLPVWMRERYHLCSLLQAFERVHFPAHDEEIESARRRLAFYEFVTLQLAFALVKQQRAEPGAALPLVGTGTLERAFRQKLPFRLTEGQERVLSEIRADLARDRPMNRLLQGDVGSGKTVVAALAAITAIEATAQVAYMAPTEILAIQQAESFQKWLIPLGRRARVLTGRSRASERNTVLAELAEGRLDVLVGTHALLEDWVHFRRLGLVIVDEQHRFGVLQRGRLRQKGEWPHCLVMSATPIPRTLSLTLYGDLDLSLLTEMPPGRIPPKTHLVPPGKREDMLRFVAEVCRRGERVFFIYPLVEESEQMDLRDATQMAATLSQHPAFTGIKIGLMHGRMSGEEKDEAMRRFRDGTTACLVSTTVVEVGVDVPQATVMVVEHPERFGLSQLHQLRGRIGRGGGESHFLMADSGSLSLEARERLRVLESQSNGFRVAEEDLRLRGPGDLLGTAQHGLPRFRVADLIGDPELLLRAREAAEEVMRRDPDLRTAEHRPLRTAILRRYAEGMNLFQVG